MTPRSVPRSPSLGSSLPAGSLVVDGRQVGWSELLAYVARVRSHADDLEAAAVTAGREAGVSWDRLSLALGGRPSGEQLRRRHSQSPGS